MKIRDSQKMSVYRQVRNYMAPHLRDINVQGDIRILVYRDIKSVGISFSFILSSSLQSYDQIFP